MKNFFERYEGMSAIDEAVAFTNDLEQVLEKYDNMNDDVQSEDEKILLGFAAGIGLLADMPIEGSLKDKAYQLLEAVQNFLIAGEPTNENIKTIK